MDDDIWRSLIVGSASILALMFLVGGWVYRVGGVWRDGARRVQLSQWGPFVWGHASFAEGRQRFIGSVFLGRLRLSRRDFGAAHLQALGFDAQQVPAMQGRSTGTFFLRVRGPDELRGTFVGRTFTQRQGKVAAIGRAPPTERTWNRDTHHMPPHD